VADSGRRFRVIGFRSVAGRRNGEEISEDDLREAGANITALIAGGHICEVRPKPARRAAKADPEPDGGDE